MTSDKGTQTKPNNKIQLLQCTFKFRPKLVDRDVARLTRGLGQTIWKFSNNQINLQKLYETYLNTSIAFKDVLEFANRLKRERPKAKFTGCVFAIKKNQDDKDEHGHYITVLKPYQYTLQESDQGILTEIKLHYDIINIRISRMKTEEEKQAARELREQMKERTLKSDKKEYKTRGIQTDDIPELAPLPRPPTLNRNDYHLNLRKIGRNRPTNVEPPTRDQNQNRIQLLLQSSTNLDEDDRPKKKSKQHKKKSKRPRSPSPPPPPPSRSPSPPPPPPPPPPSSPPPQFPSSHTSRGTSPPPREPRMTPQKTGEYTVDQRRHKIHDWRSLVNDENIEEDVIDDYLKLLYNKGKRLNKQPGQNEAEFDKKKILVLPTAFYTLLSMAYETNDMEKIHELMKSPISGKQSFTHFDKVFVPICSDGEHWVLCIVRYPKKIIECYDSENKSMAPEVKTLNKWINISGTGKLKAKYYDVPSQRNNKDCGVFLMESCRTFLHEGNGKFKQRNMPDIRKRILRELQNNELETGVVY